MKRTLAFAFVFLAASSLCAKDYTYSMKLKEVKYTLTVKITEDGGVRTVYTTDDFSLQENTSKGKLGGGVFEWTLKDKKNDTDLKAVREGNKITVTGIFKGKEIKKEHGIDDRPWHQLFTWELDYFALSKEKRMEFWALRPENPESAGVLVTYKEKEEKLTVAGEEIDTYNIKVTLGGLLSIFWTGDYWYRKTDGFYVRAKPTGDVLVELNQSVKP